MRCCWFHQTLTSRHSYFFLILLTFQRVRVLRLKHVLVVVLSMSPWIPSLCIPGLKPSRCLCCQGPLRTPNRLPADGARAAYLPHSPYLSESSNDPSHTSTELAAAYQHPFQHGLRLTIVYNRKATHLTWSFFTPFGLGKLLHARTRSPTPRRRMCRRQADVSVLFDQGPYITES